MSNNAKIWIRVVVIAGIVAWPTVESYRLLATTQKMQDALALERSVATKPGLKKRRSPYAPSCSSICPTLAR